MGRAGMACLARLLAGRFAVVSKKYFRHSGRAERDPEPRGS